MDELVDSATKARYLKKLVIILAGYTDDINRLMSTNAGLSSRFPDVIDFRSLKPVECADLLKSDLAVQRTRLKRKEITLDLTVLESPTLDLTARVHAMFATMARQPNWANARDVLTVSKKIFQRTTRDKAGMAAKRFKVRPEDVMSELKALSSERASRAASAMTGNLAHMALGHDFAPMAAPPAHQDRMKTTTTTKMATTTPEPPEPAPKAEEESAVRKAATTTDPSQPIPSALDTKRDAGVSDAVWEQLQHDKREEVRREAEYQSLKVQAEKARDADRDAIIKRLLEEEDRRRAELAIKEKLARLGKCPVGYAWIAQGDGGYRCAGGSHYMSRGEVGGL